MLSTMMDVPLTIRHILWRLEKLYPEKQLVTQRADYTPYISNYGSLVRRVSRLASALSKHGIKQGDRVATFAWNNQRHLECYFAIPCMGAVLHTLNVRLFAEHLEYIINHAEDRVIFCDRSVLPALEKVAGKIPTVGLVVLMNDGDESSGTFANSISYEDFLATGDENFIWPSLDETSAAAMCYTSGTTGKPKGVVYSHRSSVLHSLVIGHPNSVNISERDVVQYAVPMFHANGWGMPYAAALAGAAQVFSDRFLDPDHLASLLDDQGVTTVAGVPTVWIPLLNYLQSTGKRLPKLTHIYCGGSAAPPSLILGYREIGIQMIHAWGMTEMSPIGTISRLKSTMDSVPVEKQDEALFKQGTIVPTVECRIIDLDSGDELPWDGEQFGELQVRGPYVTGKYYDDLEQEDKFIDGWLKTGDVATIDVQGYLQLVDRTKDLVKSGGEWISSVELENTLMAHPKVLEAAVVGLPHPHWQERPVAVVVAKPQHAGELDADELKGFLSEKVAKWWIPDEIIIQDALPKTSVGKFAKTVLRTQLAELAQEWKLS